MPRAPLSLADQSPIVTGQAGLAGQTATDQALAACLLNPQAQRGDMKILPIVAGMVGGALGVGFASAGRAGVVQAVLLGAFASLLGAMLVAWVLEAADDLRGPSRYWPSVMGARIPRS